jgi:hypothetical protein
LLLGITAPMRLPIGCIRWVRCERCITWVRCERGVLLRKCHSTHWSAPQRALSKARCFVWLAVCPAMRLQAKHCKQAAHERLCSAGGVGQAAATRMGTGSGDHTKDCSCHERGGEPAAYLKSGPANVTHSTLCTMALQTASAGHGAG